MASETADPASVACAWARPDDVLYRSYHDHEWGVPEYDPRALWEKLVLDGFQAGLSWITILRKRESLRAAFAGFDPERVARFGDADRARLMADRGVIRSGAKIDAAIAGARLYLDFAAQGRDFSAYIWEFVDGKPIVNSWRNFRDAPTHSPHSEKLAKALHKQGFRFCGPVITYAFMQAVGMINDHEIHCPRHAACSSLAR